MHYSSHRILYDLVEINIALTVLTGFFYALTTNQFGCGARTLVAENISQTIAINFLVLKHIFNTYHVLTHIYSNCNV